MRFVPPRSTLVVRLSELTLVLLAYFLSADAGLKLALIGKNVTPLWPPTGIALFAFLILGRRAWPGVALAALLVNLPISVNALAALVTAAGNTLAPFAAAELLRRAGFHRRIDRLRDALALVLLAALGAMAISATVGTWTLLWSGVIHGRDLLGTWAVWWTGDAMGILVVAPFLLALPSFVAGPRLGWARRIEAAVLAALLVAVSLLVLHSELRITFLVFPLVGWAAWRFQQRGAAPAALVVAGLAAWAASRGIGSYGHGTLFERMLQLQAFNATVALMSFVLAALVTERARAREALERSAADLEVRVRVRTSELTAANERMTEEMAERRRAQARLEQRERQLAEAQEVASVGSWEWRIPEDRVTWSDEMFRIYGHEPQSFELTIGTAMQQIVGEDVPPIRRNLDRAFAAGVDAEVPLVEYRILRPDGEERALRGKGRVTVENGAPVRMVGTVQDVTETKRAEREHRIAETLQRSLLPDRLPDVPGVALAARYVPASSDMEIGGDWYDVIQLPNGLIGLAIGDVAGHGLQAASTMGQLRMALRAYAIEEENPADLVRRVHELLYHLTPAEMVTLIYLIFDPDLCTVRYANAGHPPPLLVGADGEADYLREGLAPPLGAVLHTEPYVEARVELPPGATLLLYTDGLIERRGASLFDGLERLRTEASAGPEPLDDLCDRLLQVFVGDEIADDVALLAVRPASLSAGALTLKLPADPNVLAPLRRTLRRWLREAGAEDQEAHDVLVAAGEAAANAIQHAYGARAGVVEVGLLRDGDEVEVSVGDAGTWRPPSGSDGGRGLGLMRALMDRVDVESGAAGTRVRMRLRLRAPAPAPA